MFINVPVKFKNVKKGAYSLWIRCALQTHASLSLLKPSVLRSHIFSFKVDKNAVLPALPFFIRLRTPISPLDIHLCVSNGIDVAVP